jgi:hypothetical protein
MTELTAASALKKPQRVPDGEVRPLAVGDPRLPASGLLLLPAAAAGEVAGFWVEVLPAGLLVVLCFTLEGAVRPHTIDPSCCGEELTLAAAAAVVLLVRCLLLLRSLLVLLLLLLLTSLLLLPPALLARLLRLVGTPSLPAVRCFASRSVRPSAR